eukprot:scaffold44947_cov212-Skeletonema_marinoi.AAC.2
MDIGVTSTAAIVVAIRDATAKANVSLNAAAAAADLATVENVAKKDTNAEEEAVFASKLELRARRP